LYDLVLERFIIFENPLLVERALSWPSSDLGRAVSQLQVPASGYWVLALGGRARTGHASTCLWQWLQRRCSVPPRITVV